MTTTRKLLASVAMAVMAMTVFSSPAQAAPPAPLYPCSPDYTLTVQDYDSDEWADYNRDGLNCWSVDDYPSLTDNRRLPITPTVYRNIHRFYDMKVISVDRYRSTFRASVDISNGSRRPDNCTRSLRCTFEYQSSDHFYVDYGNGSVKVTARAFERAIRSEVESLEALYSTAYRTSVFTVQL